MQFEFATSQRIVFGAGSLRQVGPIAASFGSRALVVTGSDPSRSAPLLQQLETHNVAAVRIATSGEPTVHKVRESAAIGREAGCQLVIGLGGGSALDAAKAIAALLTNPGDPIEYLEVIGQGKPLRCAPAPVIAIPTTAGTGSEVTRNAVLLSPEHRVKASMRSPLMLPRVAVLDPELTYGMPPSVTACTGLDALTQLIEPFISLRANPITDALCREGMLRAGRSLLRAYRQGSDAAARQDMCLASVMGGLALANAGLGAAHGLAAVLGGHFPSASHGAVCARLLLSVLRVNFHALVQRNPTSDALPRFNEVARILTGNANATADDAMTWVLELTDALAIPRLSAYGMSQDSVESIASTAAASSSMKTNPIVLTSEELRSVLQSAL
jgi:alcohol dehydrogenase class IV